MSENKRNKAGLHKKISSIFKGIPFKQNDDVQKPFEETEPQSISHTEPEAASLEPQFPAPQEEVFESKPSSNPDAEQSPAPQPEEIQSQEPEEPKASELKDSLLLKMDGFNPKESEESQPEESRPQKETPISKPKKPVILTMDESNIPETQEFNHPEPQEIQSSKPQEAPISKPKESVVLRMDESNIPETEESKHPEPEEIQSSKPQEPPVLKTEETTQSLHEVEPSQELQADIGDDDIEKDSSGKFATVKIAGKLLWEQIDKKLLAPKPGVNPTKQKVIVLMIPLLFVMLIFVFRGVFGTSVRNTEAAEENNTSGVAARSDNKIEWEIPAPYTSKIRNPLQLGQAETTSEDDMYPGQLVQLNLKGILYSEDNPSAAVSGQIVHEGEKIRGATVVKITKEYVEFEINGKKWTQKVR